MPDNSNSSPGIIRLEVQVEHLTKEVSALKDLIVEQKTPSDLRVQSVEQLMNARLTPIEEALKALTAKFEEKTKPNYGPIIALCGLLWGVSSTIGGFFINAQNTTIARIESDIKAIQASAVPRAEFSDLRADINRRFDLQGKRIEGLEHRRWQPSR